MRLTAGLGVRAERAESVERRQGENRLRRLWITAIAGLCLLIITACGLLPTAQRNDKLGVILSREDAPGSAAHDVLAGLRAGTDLPLVLKTDGGSPEQAAAAARELAADPDVLAVVAATDYACRAAAATVLDKAGLVMLSASGFSAPEEGAPGRTFSMTPGARRMAFAAARYASSALGASRVLVATAAASPWPQLGHLFLDEAAKAGLAVDGACLGVSAAEELSGCAARRIEKAEEPANAVVCFGPYDESFELARDLRRRGFSQNVVAVGDGLSLRTEAGLEGVYESAAFLWDMAPLASTAFYNFFLQRFGAPPSPAAALGRDAGWLLQRAVDTQGPDRERVRSFLVELARRPEPLMGVTGPLAFEPSGDARRRILFASSGETGLRPAMLQLPSPWSGKFSDAGAAQPGGMAHAVRIKVEPKRISQVNPARGTFRAEVLIRLMWAGDAPVQALTLEPSGISLIHAGATLSRSRENAVSSRTILVDREFPLIWPGFLPLGEPAALPLTVACSPSAASELAVVLMGETREEASMDAAGYRAMGSVSRSGYEPLASDGEGPRLLERFEASRLVMVRPLLRGRLLGFWLPVTLPLLLGLGALLGPANWRKARLLQSHLSLVVLLAVQVWCCARWSAEIGYPYGWVFFALADVGLVVSVILCWLGVGPESESNRLARRADFLGRWLVAPVVIMLWAGFSAYLW